MGSLGDDLLACRVLHVSTTRADISLVKFDPETPTGAYFKDPQPELTRVFDHATGLATPFMVPEIAAAALHEPPRVVKPTGVTAGRPGDYDAATQELIRAARPRGEVLSFDLNCQAELWGRTRVAPRLLKFGRQADVVLAGMDEALALRVLGGLSDILRLLTEGLLVVKDGKHRTTVFYDGCNEFVTALKVAVPEPAGARDGFAVGWLSAVLEAWLAAVLSLDAASWVDVSFSSSCDWVQIPSPTGDGH